MSLVYHMRLLKNVVMYAKSARPCLNELPFLHLQVVSFCVLVVFSYFVLFIYEISCSSDCYFILPNFYVTSASSCAKLVLAVCSCIGTLRPCFLVLQLED